MCQNMRERENKNGGRKKLKYDRPDGPNAKSIEVNAPRKARWAKALSKQLPRTMAEIEATTEVDEARLWRRSATF